MKPIIRNLLFSAALGASLPLQAAPTLVENGDFEIPDGASWEEVSGGGTYAFNYSPSGGNPGGYGVIDHSTDDGGFGIWVANGNETLALAALGLTAGESYRFSQDMIILSGSNLGGFKVDFFTGTDSDGSTGDIFPTLIGDGSTWETYTFNVTIPPTADGIKIVPLWGTGSSIGYDNICFDPTPIVVPLIPNGDFEAGGASWFEQGAPETTFSYPATGGNPGGHGVMTNSGSGSGNWVANGGGPLSLASLGLAGGDTVTFQQDMALLSGSNIGGLRIDFLEGASFLGDSGQMYPDLIGNGSTWETYSFEVSLPTEADHIKIVPLWGLGSSVAFDNVTFVRTVRQPFAMNVTPGTAVTWTPGSEVNFYQPQSSANGVDWVNLGPVLVGDAITSAFDRNGSPFYRVLETPVDVIDAALNGGFETPDPSDPDQAESWTSLGTQPPTRITNDVRSGAAAIRIRSANDNTPNANTSEIQQNIFDAGGLITPGDTYDFSFWAKQITSGVTYVQQFRVQWLASGGAILPGGTNFASFSGGTGEWTEITAPGLVAPEGAETALIQILGNTGAVAGTNAQGEVLIDDLTLITSSTGPATEEATSNGAFEFLDPNDFLCSEFWTCAGTQTPTNVIYDSRSGIASMELRVQNNASATPNSSEIRHDISDGGGSITPGATYDFSFWAKEVVRGVSLVQQYRLQWLDAGGAVMPGGIDFTSFIADSEIWTEIAAPDMVAPLGAASALIEIRASTGAVAGGAAEGTLLIDDVSLAAAIMPDVLPASGAPGVEIAFATEAGQLYQVRRSPDLESFEDFGPPITGDGGTWSATDLVIALAQFYIVVESAP